MPASDNTALKDDILRLLEQNRDGDGLSDAELGTRLKHSDVTARVLVLNDLLKARRVRLANRKTADGRQEVLYQFRSERDAAKLEGINNTTLMAYEMILQAKQNGLTKRDIKLRSNIQSASEIKEMIEWLISRDLVKEIKSVQGSNRKVLIATEYEPSTAHTGGPWYNDEKEFDTEFIAIMYSQLLNFVRKNDYVTVKRVTAYVAELTRRKIFSETLKEKDVSALLTTMLYDGVIQQCEGAGDGGEYFKFVDSAPSGNHLKDVPCSSCPVFHDCAPNGVISPKTCAYMTEWLNQAW